VPASIRVTVAVFFNLRHCAAMLRFPAADTRPRLLPENSRGISPDFRDQLFKRIPPSARWIRLPPVSSIIPIQGPDLQIRVEFKLGHIHTIPYVRVYKQRAGFHEGYPVPPGVVFKPDRIAGPRLAERLKKLMYPMQNLFSQSHAVVTLFMEKNE
jgi:hypothetical protein